MNPFLWLQTDIHLFVPGQVVRWQSTDRPKKLQKVLSCLVIAMQIHHLLDPSQSRDILIGQYRLAFRLVNFHRLKWLDITSLLCNGWTLTSCFKNFFAKNWRFINIFHGYFDLDTWFWLVHLFRVPIGWNRINIGCTNVQIEFFLKFKIKLRLQI